MTLKSSDSLLNVGKNDVVLWQAVTMAKNHPGQPAIPDLPEPLPFHDELWALGARVRPGSK